MTRAVKISTVKAASGLLGSPDAEARSAWLSVLGAFSLKNAEGREVALNPNLAAAWIFSGWVKTWLGQPDKAIEREERAMRLSPNDPQLYNMQAATAAAHFVAQRCEEALSWAEMSIREQPDYIPSQAVAAASAALAGRPAAAAKSMAPPSQPYARLTPFQSHRPLSNPETGRFRSLDQRPAQGGAASE